MNENTDELKDKPPIDDLVKANAYRDSLLSRADGYANGVYPYWYGWAIMDAYLAGMKSARKEGAKVEQQKTPEEWAEITLQNWIGYETDSKTLNLKDEITKTVKQAITAERESCAKTVEAMDTGWPECEGDVAKYAAAIRARNDSAPPAG